MTAISVMEKGCGNSISKYNLDQSGYRYHVGTLICINIANYKDVSFKSLYIQKQDGKPEKLWEYPDREIWQDRGSLYNYLADMEAQCWHLDCLIHGVLVSFYGQCHGTMVTVVLPDGADILDDIEFMLYGIEVFLKDT